MMAAFKALSSNAHYVLGGLGIASATVLAALHDIPGSTAIALVAAIVGVGIGAGVAGG